MTYKQFSAKGGKAGTGEAKARTSEQARAAVQARWKKHRKTKRVTAKPNGESSDASDAFAATICSAVRSESSQKPNKTGPK